MIKTLNKFGIEGNCLNNKSHVLKPHGKHHTQW